MNNKQIENKKRLELVAKILTADSGINITPEHAYWATRLQLSTGQPFKLCLEVAVFFDENINKLAKLKYHE